MGYFASTNAFVEKRVRGFAGFEYPNQVMGILSSLGVLGGWLCLPAAYYVSSRYDNGFLEGFYFMLAVIGGGAIPVVLKIPTLEYLLSSITLFVNIGLTFAVYSMTHSY